MEYSEIRDELKTGDIVLFGGKGGVSDVIKHFSGSKFSHIGMVLDVPEWDFKCVWESTTLGGLRDLDTGTMMKGVQLVPLSARVEMYDGDISFRQLQGPAFGENTIQTLMNFRQRMKGKPYERSQAELFKSLYDSIGGDNSTDLSSIFCSELLSETFMELCILDHSLPSNEYTPADFNQTKWKLPFINGYSLGAEIQVKYA